MKRFDLMNQSSNSRATPKSFRENEFQVIPEHIEEQLDDEPINIKKKGKYAFVTSRPNASDLKQPAHQ